jgi:hypothetical protein
MQLSRLSEIDLAKAMTVPPGPALEAEMRYYNAGGGAWSYDPTRVSTSDLVGAAAPLVGPLSPVSWPKLERQIRSACNRGQTQTDSNLQVSKVLFDAARDRGWSAVQEPMGSLSVGFGESVRYWSDVVIADADGPFIPFFDHRRRGGLTTAVSRHIVFSMQHIGVRERNPDLGDVRLAVVRFPVIGNARWVQIYFHDGSNLLAYEELDTRVRTVYETWARVSNERVAKRRAAGGGGPTPFGF